jgi:hypothetical protein
MLEATTTQNDLVLTFFLMSSVYFFLKGLKDCSKKMLLASGIALGIALGTKGVALFILPGLLCAGVIYLIAGYPSLHDASMRTMEGSCVWYKRGTENHFLVSWLSYLIVSFVITGSYVYVQNFLQYGFPLGQKVILDTHATFSFSNMAKNLIFIFWRFFDTSGLTFVRILVFMPVLRSTKIQQVTVYHG